jgi:hypothetical protein
MIAYCLLKERFLSAEYMARKRCCDSRKQKAGKCKHLMVISKREART